MGKALTRKKWSSDETTTLLFLKSSGFSKSSIAKLLGRTEISIQERLIRTKDKKMSRHGKPWTKEEDEILLNNLMEPNEFKAKFERGQKETDMRRFILRRRSAKVVMKPFGLIKLNPYIGKRDLMRWNLLNTK
jgi:hypothetical protein